jgi:NAD-dependent SIR2 family protein deacetylase
MKSGKKGREHRTCPIYEINGNVLKIRCNHCSIEKGELQSEPYETYEFILSMQSKLYCSSCEGPLRPHILLHDEFYDEIFNSSKTVLTLAEQADLVLVIGSPVLSSLANEVIAVAA